MAKEPVRYSPELATRICERLATGETLRAVCRDEGMPTEAAVRDWVIRDHDGFASHYARARDKGLDALADQVIEISDRSDLAPDDRRVRVDTRKWYLSKLAPKRYGDRIQHEHTGGVIAGTIVIGAATAALPGDGAKVIEGKVESDDA